MLSIALLILATLIVALGARSTAASQMAEVDPLDCDFTSTQFFQGIDYRLTEMSPVERSFAGRFEGIYEYNETGCAPDVAFVFESEGRLIGLPGRAYQKTWHAKRIGKLPLFSASSDQ